MSADIEELGRRLRGRVNRGRVNEARLTPGERMPDGTVYAGVSPDTGEAMYTTPEDAPLRMTWEAAMDYAAKLEAHGRHIGWRIPTKQEIDEFFKNGTDERGRWRVPTKGELNVLFNNRAAIGGFDKTGAWPEGWYWSSSQFNDDNALNQRFSTGTHGINDKYNGSSLRCVRG
jgi:hypothetical protein